MAARLRPEGAALIMLHYLDNAATTRVSPAAAQAALKAMTEDFGNPSSRHKLGSEAAGHLKEDRAAVAAALGCLTEEIFFTSCGSESDNWAIRGAVRMMRRKGNHIVTTAIEHSAVLEPMKALEQEGFSVTYLKPDKQGVISPEAVEEAIRPDTILVSMMLVNNELGTILPVEAAARAIRKKGSPALLHCDAVQGFLKVPFTPKSLGADLLSLSGHKIHAPKGIGALYIRKGLKLPPLMLGGGQENGLRPGTEPTAQIAAFAAACREGKASFAANREHMAAMKAQTIELLTRDVPGLLVLTDGGAPHILPISMPGYKSEVLVRYLSDRDICISSGSACHRGKPSHVYAALGLPKPVLDGALRVSFSDSTTIDDLNALRDGLVNAQKELFQSLS